MVRHIGFTRPVKIGKGAKGVTLHQQVVSLPERNAAELAADNPGAVVDLTPKDFGYLATVPTRMTTLRAGACRVCGGARRMTLCAACGGSGREVLA